ncbi:transcription factor with AP2 domain(s), putative (ApiAP2), partial [Plasmodium ovale curtisi]
ETNKGKCYPQKSPAVANSYKYNLKNVNGLTKEEKTNFLRDSESLQASSGVENSYNNKRTSLTIMNNTDKDLLYTPSDRRSNFKDTDGSVINENNNNDTSNIYEYLLENKMNSNIFLLLLDIKATYLPSSAANSVSHDENYSDMVYDERINFTGKSKKKLDKKYKSNNNMDPNYMNYMNDGTYDMREDKNNNSLFKKSGNNPNNGNDNNNVSPSNTAISNLGSGPNYSPTNMYEIDNTHNTLDYYIKSENAANGLGKLEDLKNMKNNNYNQTSSFLKGDIRNGEGINENNMYSKNLNNADYEDTQNLMNNKMNSHNLEDKLNRPYSNNMLYNNSENNNYENTNIHINEERDIRINKEVNKCKFVDGLIYDEANKCFRIKINGYRKAYSVIRRGVKEAYKLSIEAIQQIKKQSKANNYNTSEQPQINSNNLTHFYNS